MYIPKFLLSHTTKNGFSDVQNLRPQIIWPLVIYEELLLKNMWKRFGGSRLLTVLVSNVYWNWRGDMIIIYMWCPRLLGHQLTPVYDGGTYRTGAKGPGLLHSMAQKKKGPDVGCFGDKCIGKFIKANL